MSIDIAALVRTLREDRAQRDALREVLGADDIDVRTALAELAAAQRRTEERVDALAAQVAALAGRVDALAAQVAALAGRVDALSAQVAELAAAQLRTERAVNGLIDVVAGMQDRMGKLDGSDLERRYRERGPAYLSRLALRLRVVDSTALAAMVADAEESGALSQGDAESLMVADAVFTGQLRRDRTWAHLVVEVSVTVARNDVRRARERADLLARIVDTPVVAVVAGDHVPEPVAAAAQDADVWCVARGRVLAPDGDVEDFL